MSARLDTLERNHINFLGFLYPLKNIRNFYCQVNRHDHVCPYVRCFNWSTAAFLWCFFPTSREKREIESFSTCLRQMDRACGGMKWNLWLIQRIFQATGIEKSFWLFWSIFNAELNKYLSVYKWKVICEKTTGNK